MLMLRLLPLVAPAAVFWAERQSRRGLREGLPLSVVQLAQARAVGVVHPERIRINYVAHMPFPGTWLSYRLARLLGVPGPQTVGLTLGYSLYIIAEHMSPRLLAHECRHVYQFEQAGSLAAFIPEYLRQVFRHGYFQSPLEVDARLHEGEGD